MSYIGTEETQKEAEFFSNSNLKEYSIVCITGDMNRKLGWAINFTQGGYDPVYLSTARGDFRMFKTVDAAVALMMSKGVSNCSFFFDPR